jgi:5-methylcytosine-specific restriction enzyme B
MPANSWTKVENSNKIFARKVVDFSVFTYGIHIPKDFREDFLKHLLKPIAQGENVPIDIVIEDKTFKAKMWNIDEKKREDDVIQIRYDSNGELKEYLKQTLKISYNYIINNKVEGSKRSITLPKDLEEIIEFYVPDKKDTFELHLITQESKTIKDEFFSYIGEKDVLESNKYQASYKLVLLLNLLKGSNNEGQASYHTVCEKITSFYLDTYKKYSKAEAENIEIEKKINSLTINSVKSIMNDNAYRVIKEKGYIFKKNNEDELLCFSEELWKELSDYDKENLIDILDSKLKIYYQQRVDILLGEEVSLIENEIEIEEITEVIKYIQQFISSKGYDFDEDTIKNYYLSLKTKPFVLLAGISGTGKSKLVKLFAEALGATSSNGRFSLIPVRPDWSDPSDLLGYKDINGKFQPGPLANIIKLALKDKSNKPYFICMDEMNLARVEYYFSDILSVMETREKDISTDRIITDKIFKKEFFGSDTVAYNEYGNLYMPDNLYIIGTVNMDETTFPFSKKVLDRANTIEFNFVSLKVNFDEGLQQNTKALSFYNNRLASKYIKLKECSNHKEQVNNIIDFLEKINNCLTEMSSHFGYRVRDEITFYVLYALQDNLLEVEEALDNAVKQKILPRIQGSNLRTKEVLLQLIEILAGTAKGKYDVYDSEVASKLKKDILDDSKKDDNEKVKYEKSIRKIIKMIRRFDLDGFTAFWE